jgi:hypothetical protein
MYKEGDAGLFDHFSHKSVFVLLLKVSLVLNRKY